MLKQERYRNDIKKEKSNKKKKKLSTCVNSNKINQTNMSNIIIDLHLHRHLRIKQFGHYHLKIVYVIN